VLTLVDRARRRLFHNELFSQGAYAAIAVLAALILLLLVGTRILDGRWILLFSVLAAGAALYRARKRLPSPYAAAQVVDRRLELADTISTAVYFREESPQHVSPAICQFQLERAGQVSASVDVRRAVPYAMPRSVYLAAVLVLVAGSLFGLRYGLMGRLDLQPPLARMLQQQLGWNQPTEVAKNTKRKPPQVPEAPDDAGASVSDPDQTQSMQPDTSANDGSDASNDSGAEKGDSSKGDAKKDGNRASKSGADGDQEAQADSNPSESGEKSGQEAGKQDQKQQSGGKPEGEKPGENSSLMNKAKDLLQNLLSSLKPPPSNPANQQQNGDPNNQQGKGQPKQQNDKNGQPQNSGQKGDQSEGQQGEQGQDQQDQAEQGNGKNDSQQGKKQPGSGAGNQDGDKRIKQAEDLAAMGKITEILGKRSANLTGEATVEVQSTSQQLRTAYAPGTAQHGQSGGEINRDEIPVAMEPYVQEYFKQARKQVPAPPPPAAKKQ
jgi:hypothetical protein